VVHGGLPLQTYAVVLTAATVVAVGVGFVLQSLDVALGRRTAGWLVLVTVTGQLLGWMLAAFCTSRPPGDAGPALLLLTRSVRW
jgi:hypothetical protein